jgi:hypothetical protein
MLYKTDYSDVVKVLPPVHTTFESAYIIADYPYSFKLRCEKRVWIETNNKGQRLVECTKNPKTGSWNKPKCAIYSDLLILYIDGKGYIQHTNTGIYDLSFRSSEVESLEKFIAFFQDGILPEFLSTWTNIIKTLKSGKSFMYRAIPVINYEDKVCTINGQPVVRLV